MRPEDAWQSVLGEIEINMGRSSYLTWLKSARLMTYEDGQFVIGVANGYAKEWIEQRKLTDIKKMLSERMNRGVDVRLIVSTGPHGPAISPVQSPGVSQGAGDSYRRTDTNANNSGNGGYTPAPSQSPSPSGYSAYAPAGVANANVPAPAVVTAPNPNITNGANGTADGLQTRYTFEAFVVGSGNRMAHAAAMAVAEMPVDRYNPLFLYGGSGLGKTHLLHAIGNSVKRRGMTCRYVTSETFTNELISAIRSQSQESFRNKYRSVDVLLMDDVQFIAGKESTQEEFFHTFNALHGANKQIVMTSDRAPKMMVTLEDRLRSRFEWGLMVDIAPPDLETRMAILQHKVAQMNYLGIPADVIEFVAKQIQSNVRELEGALTRLIATSEMTGRSISVQFARDTLADLVGRRAHITPSQVIETVAKYYSISVPEMVSPSRNRELVQPRQIAMYLIRQETDASLPEIGSLLGGRDHTTIIHGVERIKERLEAEETLRRDVMSVREQLYLNVTA